MQPSAREQPAVAVEALRPLDVLILCWLAAGALLAVAFRSVPAWKEVALGYALLSLAALAIVLWNASRPSPASRFLREAYPLLFLLPMYEGAGQLIHLLTPAIFDAQVVALERAILGESFWPWIVSLESVVLTEILNGFYFCYYVILGLPAVWIYLRGDVPGFRRMATAVILAFVPCFTLFILVPVEGPRFYLAEELGTPRGSSVTWWVHAVLDQAGHQGAAFPSSHVAAAVAAMWAGWKAHRPLGMILLPLVIGLSLATVYGRYHYPTDVVAGVLIGLFAIRVARRLAPAG